MDCSSPGFPVLHHLPELAQTHVHWVGDAIQPSHPLWPSSPPLFHVTGMCPALFGQILPGWPSCSMWVSLFDLASHIAPSRDAPVTVTLVLADGKTFYSITHFRVLSHSCEISLVLQEQIQLFQPQGSLNTVPWLGLALDGSEADFTVLSREPLNGVCSVTQPCPTLCDPKDCSPPGSSVHGILQARTLECVAMPLSIFPTQGLNPDPPALQVDSYQLSHQGSPWILEWVAYPLSRGSSHPRNRPGVSYIAGGFFTSWANSCSFS